MKISVVMCTYNGEKYVKEQLESILNQTYAADEIIVCDDRSTDKTIEIVREVLSGASPDYKIIVNEVKKGVADNFMNGLKAATGDYIFTCDQDDVWRADKIETFVKEINKEHKLLYFSNGTLVDSECRSMGRTLWQTLAFDVDLLKTSTYLEILINRCIVTGAAMAVSRRLVSKIDAVPKGWLHDGWFAMCAAVEDSLQAVDRETFLYRQHGNNVVGAQKKSFIGKVRAWADNIKIMEDVRHERYMRYKAVLPICKDEARCELEGCISFWSEMDSLSELKRMQALGIVMKNMKNGNYKKYYAGSRAALRDVISIFV